MKRAYLVCAVVAAWMPAPAVLADEALIKEVIKTLNDNKITVNATDESKSYKILFDAYLEMSKPPFVVGPEFNLATIHPKMPTWSAVSGWAESNSKMAQAILKCKDKVMIGLPYGREKVDAAYLKAGLFCDIGVGGSLRENEFPYMTAQDTIAAFATAEIYRLMEVGQVQQALDLAIAHCFVQRQFCDRDFLVEKLHSIGLLSEVMSNLRDVFYLYQDKATSDQLAKIAIQEIPYLRPDRGRLFMPEADRVVAEALIKEVFSDKTANPDPEKFSETFADIQSKHAPLTRFGAARRWRMIVPIHGSLDASLHQLKLIYDDWWRRWRIDAYDDEMLRYPTQFSRTNSIRYAAVMFSAQDVEVLFQVRNRLIAEVNGTAIVAGLCAYRRNYNSYPDKTEKTYTEFDKKRSDSDPYFPVEVEGGLQKVPGPFHYMFTERRQSVNTQYGPLAIEKGQAFLYSVGRDHEDNRGAQHTDDGTIGDMVIWPPIKSLARAQGKLE